MKNDILTILAFGLMILAFGLPFIGLVMVDRERDTLQKDAVNRGYAIHNPTNGVWQWK